MTMIGAAPMRSRNVGIAVKPSTPGKRTSSTTASSGLDAGDPQALLHRGGHFHVMPLVGERLAKCPADAHLVVDDQDPAHAASFGVPFAVGKVRRKRVSPSLRVPGQPPAVVAGHAMGQGQAEPDPFGLAGDERLAQGIGQLRRRPRAGVGHFDGDLVAVGQSPRGER